ncbi:MAG: SH3 domain-containing protein [Christensenellales bacterium]
MKKRIKLTAILLASIVIFTLLWMPVTAKAESVMGAGTVTTASGPLNVRASASASSAIVSALPKGSYVTLLSNTGSWWHVKYGRSAYGYCSASYITRVASAAVKTVAISSGSLNVRSGAGTGYGIIGTLVNGTAVVVLSVSGSWSRILYDGTKLGYASSAYLGGASAPAGYSAVSLAVPSYKQNDSRWANYPVGSSGRTISDIGCLTTALAMAESYRLGKTIYPNTMASQLTYTSGGAAYWPPAYKFYTGTDYLAKIYELLKSNKPVIVGGKTSSGSTHYVVVTGFSGGALTASNFKMNDPGYTTRTTLNQLFAYYPVFIKIAYAS